MIPSIKRVNGQAYDYAEKISRGDAKFYYNKGYEIGINPVNTGDTYVIVNTGCSFEETLKVFKQTINKQPLRYYRLS